MLGHPYMGHYPYKLTKVISPKPLNPCVVLLQELSDDNMAAALRAAQQLGVNPSPAGVSGASKLRRSSLHVLLFVISS